jgi:hypothetical protein
MVNSQPYLKSLRFRISFGKSGQNWYIFQLSRWTGKESRWNYGVREGDLLFSRERYQIHLQRLMDRREQQDTFYFRWIELCERLKGVAGFPYMDEGQIIVLNNLISSNLVLFYQIVLWVQMSDSGDFDGFWCYISTMVLRFLRNSCNLLISLSYTCSANVYDFLFIFFELPQNLHLSCLRASGPGFWLGRASMYPRRV